MSRFPVRSSFRFWPSSRRFTSRAQGHGYATVVVVRVIGYARIAMRSPLACVLSQLAVVHVCIGQGMVFVLSASRSDLYAESPAISMTAIKQKANRPSMLM
jgi:hypothetical protein